MMDARTLAYDLDEEAHGFGGASPRGLAGWAVGVMMTAFYVVLYWWPQYLELGMRAVDFLSQALNSQPADRWFLYGTLYTAATLFFGVRMLRKYRHVRYQQIRTVSVMFFQSGFAFEITGAASACSWWCGAR